MKTKNLILIALISFSFFSCHQQEARRPVTKSKSYTLADTSYEMKKINQLEEEKIKTYMQLDSTTTYLSSSNGYWYSFVVKNEEELPTPKKGDAVDLELEILDLNNNIIYSKDEIGLKSYKVDKEDFIPALQLGIKSMKVGETVKFVIPSYNAFGVVGDQNKIGINQSIISIVTLKNIIEENEDN